MDVCVRGRWEEREKTGSAGRDMHVRFACPARAIRPSTFATSPAMISPRLPFCFRARSPLSSTYVALVSCVSLFCTFQACLLVQAPVASHVMLVKCRALDSHRGSAPKAVRRGARVPTAQFCSGMMRCGSYPIGMGPFKLCISPTTRRCTGQPFKKRGESHSRLQHQPLSSLHPILAIVTTTKPLRRVTIPSPP